MPTVHRAASGPASMAKVPEHPAAGTQPGSGPFAKEERVSFEVKLTFMVAILFFYPVALCIQLHRKPSVDYWIGHWILIVGISVAVWVMTCHCLLVAGILKRRNAALSMVVLPAALLAIACQIQELRFRSASAALFSTDCQSFADKARLERAFVVAQAVMDNCSTGLADVTGASAAETRAVLRIADCPGYVEGRAVHGHEWRYLEAMEKEHHCGGWCTPHRPVWHPSEPMQDSCSLAAATVMGGSIARMGHQVTVYSALLLLCSSVAMLVMPGLLGAARY